MLYIFAFNMCSFEFKNKSSWGRVHSNTHGSDVLGQGEPAGWLCYVKGNSSSVTVKSRRIQVRWDLHYLVSTCMNIRFKYIRLNATAMFYVLFRIKRTVENNLFNVYDTWAILPISVVYVKGETPPFTGNYHALLARW
jgi:hypothetical protein